MRRKFVVLATIIALVAPTAGCGTGNFLGNVVETGKINGPAVFSADRKTCTFSGYEATRSKSDAHPLPSHDDPRTYDNSVCRSGKPVEFVLGREGALEVTYEIKYKVIKAVDGENCQITYEPLEVGWPTDKQAVKGRSACTGYTTGSTVKRRHTAPQEGEYVA